MKHRFAIVAITVVTVGLGLGVLGILWLKSPEPEPATVTDSPQETVTLTLSVGGGSDTTIRYSCPTPAGGMDVCTASIPANDYVWSEEIKVPVGTRVHVQARGTIPASCTITDESDQLALDEQRGSNARCSTVAG